MNIVWSYVWGYSACEESKTAGVSNHCSWSVLRDKGVVWGRGCNLGLKVCLRGV